MKKKILLISPFENNINIYPHLKDFIDIIQEHFEIEYFFFPERGYWIKNIITNFFKHPFKKFHYKPIFLIFRTIYRLYKIKNINYKTIIAIDNFPYTIAGLVLKKEIILWNHDFISLDNPDINYFVNKIILKKCKKLLKKNKKLIIQDENRLINMLDTLNLEKKLIKFFLLPVSLKKIQQPNEYVNSTRPILMQIGGINAYRSHSDLILNHYQLNSTKYTLFFHGYIDNQLQKLLGKCSEIPIISSVPINSKYLYKIISNSHIGFISYDNADKNFYYIDKASGQLAEFIRLGKPIILLGDNTIANFLKISQTGISIKTIDELNSAIKTITDNYTYYSDNCKKLFNDIYCINNYSDALIKYLNNYD